MGGRISETTIREVRDRADIIEVISETVPLTRAGASFRGLCPFHREKTPSFFVNPARQAFKCFGCGEGGSVFHFLMKARNLSFADAVEELAGRYGMEVRYEGGRPHARPREDLYAILRLAVRDVPGAAGRPFGEGGPGIPQAARGDPGGGAGILPRLVGARGRAAGRAEEGGDRAGPGGGGGLLVSFRAGTPGAVPGARPFPDRRRPRAASAGSAGGRSTTPSPST